MEEFYNSVSLIHSCCVCGFSVLISALFFFLNLIFLFQRGLVFFSRYDFYQCVFFHLKYSYAILRSFFFLVNCPIALSSRTDFGRSTDWNNYEILVFFFDELKKLLIQPVAGVCFVGAKLDFISSADSEGLRW